MGLGRQFAEYLNPRPDAKPAETAIPRRSTYSPEENRVAGPSDDPADPDEHWARCWGLVAAVAGSWLIVIAATKVLIALAGENLPVA